MIEWQRAVEVGGGGGGGGAGEEEILGLWIRMGGAGVGLGRFRDDGL